MLSLIKRWPRLTCFILLLGVVLAHALLSVTSRWLRISTAGFEAVQLGMTQAQVEAILGPPDDTSGKTIDMVGTGPLVDGTLAFWTAPGPGWTQIMVCYQGGVSGKRFLQKMWICGRSITVYRKENGEIIDSRYE